MAVMATSYHAIFYDHQVPAAGPLALWLGIGAVLLWVASTTFERRRENFADVCKVRAIFRLESSESSAWRSRASPVPSRSCGSPATSSPAGWAWS